jgi:hypothetical protein
LVLSDSKKTSADNSELYERIGDLVIARAHAGDKDCLRIFELALRKTEGQVRNPNQNNGKQS